MTEPAEPIEANGRTKIPTEDIPRPAKKSPKLTREDEKLRESVKSMYEGVAMLALSIGMPKEDQALVQFGTTLMSPQGAIDATTGDIVVLDQRSGAEKAADLWMTAGERNPKIKAALKRVTEGGALAEIFAFHLSLLIPFLPGIPGLAFLAPAMPTTSPNGAGPV